MCKPLMSDVPPKVHQNNRSYVSSADLHWDSIRKILAWWAVTRRASKNQKTVKIGGWALAGDNTVLNLAILVIRVIIAKIRYSQLTSQMIYHRGGEPERAMHC